MSTTVIVIIVIVVLTIISNLLLLKDSKRMDLPNLTLTEKSRSRASKRARRRQPSLTVFHHVSKRCLYRLNPL